MIIIEGWISIYRKLKSSWIWLSSEPFDKRSAWIDLLLRASHKDVRINFNKSYLDLNVGEFVTSIDKLSKEWKWSRHKVSDFLNLLEKERYVGTGKGQQKNSYKYCKLCNVSTRQKNNGHVHGHETGQQKSCRRTQSIMIIILFILLINIKELHEILVKD